MSSPQDPQFAGSNQVDESQRSLQARVESLEAELLRLKDEHRQELAAGKSYTEQLQHEIEARRLTETHLQAVVSNAPVVLWAMDGAGNVVVQEGLGLAALGVRPGQTVGSNIFEMYAAHPEILGYITRALHGEYVSVQIHPTMASERTFETHYTPHRLADGSIGGVIAVSTDITARVDAEKALRQANVELEARVATRTAELDAANHLLHSIVQAQPAGVVVTEQDGCLLLDNAMAERLWPARDVNAAPCEPVYQARQGWWTASGEPLAAGDWPWRACCARISPCWATGWIFAWRTARRLHC